jgi:hypothetical protein
MLKKKKIIINTKFKNMAIKAAKNKNKNKKKKNKKTKKNNLLYDV